MDKEIENADLIINLAGRSVNCRYNEKIEMKFSIAASMQQKYL
jgi:NAD dependent epimerase/dehydratase family enzyme